MPQSFFAAKAIGKKLKFDPGIIAIEVRNEVEKQGRAVAASYRETVEHWEGDKPIFGVTKRQVAPSRTRDVELTVGVKGGTEFGSDKWTWLDEGTKVRWAVMHPRFRRKTTPNTTKTRQGAHPEPTLRGMKSMQFPRPGIKARNWTRIIVNRHTPSFRRAVRLAVIRGAERAIR